MTIERVRRRALVAAGLAAGLFVVLAWAVCSNGTVAIDEAGMQLFRTGSRPIGPAWLGETARDLTALGSNGVLALLVVLLAGRAALAGRARDALALVAAFGGGLVMVAAAKSLMDRPRPTAWEPLAQVFTTSFPSSHATLSVAVLGTAALLVRGRVGDAERRLVTALTVLVCLTVGASRVYLGLHWPSDVLAGWLLGSAITMTCAAVWPASMFPQNVMPAPGASSYSP